MAVRCLPAEAGAAACEMNVKTAPSPGRNSGAVRIERMSRYHGPRDTARRFDKALLPPPAEVLRRLDAQKITHRGEWLSCCCPLPDHYDRDPSFSIHAIVGNWRCHGCGATGGDVLELFRRATGAQFLEAAEALGALCDADPRSEATALRPHEPPQHTAPIAAPLEWSDTAERIWRRTQGLRGTLGETYLQHRGCALPPRDSHLRFLPSDGPHPPSLCAAITDATTGRPLSLHFTRLAADGRGKAGTERDKLLLRGHRKAGGVIRLWPDEAVTGGLAIAEGVETALAAAHAFTPVWAAIDAGNLAAFPVLPGIEALTILADHDEAGLRAAAACSQRWADAGREARIATPDEDGADMADLVAA